MRAARATSARLISSRSLLPSNIRAAASSRLRRAMPGARDEALSSRREFIRILHESALRRTPKYPGMRRSSEAARSVDSHGVVHDTRLRLTKGGSTLPESAVVLEAFYRGQ